jgi:uncharacterized protein
MKLLFWLALFLLVYLALRDKSRRSQSASPGASERRDAAQSGQSGGAEPMLQCRQCGVHFPASEAARNALGDAFCCEEHRRTHGS